MSNIFKKIWGKKKTNYEAATVHQPKDKNYFHVAFQNHENPENSFEFDNKNPLNVYYTGKSHEKNTPFNKNSETKFILKPKRRQKSVHKKTESSSEETFLEASKSSIALSMPTTFTWKNKDAFIYKVESKFCDDGQRPDLEFVIYIPIDTAVKWLKSSVDKTPEYIYEQANSEPNEERAINQSSEQKIRYGSELENVGRKYTITWKNQSTSDSDSDDDEDDQDQDNDPKPNKLKEKKVRGPKKSKKKARRIITTYEEDEDEISLGRLRPKTEEKEPLKIVAQKKLY